MEVYTRYICPLHTTMEPTSLTAIKPYVNVFSDITLADPIITGAYGSLPQVVWFLYAQRLQTNGSGMIKRMRSLAAMGQLTTIKRSKVPRSGEYGLTAIQSAYFASIAEIFTEIAEKVKASGGRIVMIFKYGVLTTGIDQQVLKDIMADSVPMPISITIKKVEE